MKESGSLAFGAGATLALAFAAAGGGAWCYFHGASATLAGECCLCLGACLCRGACCGGSAYADDAYGGYRGGGGGYSYGGYGGAYDRGYNHRV